MVMDIAPARSQRQPKLASPAVVLPDELIPDILSLLTVKSLTRLRCVSKSWNTLISDPTFVKLHVNRSARNTHLALMQGSPPDFSHDEDRSIVLFPVRHLLENPSTTVPDDPCYGLKDNHCCWVVGSCNGLLCLVGSSVTAAYRDNWLCFWNPATRTISEKLGSFRHFDDLEFGSFKFMFGYDNSTDTYKVVAFRVVCEEDDEVASCKGEVRVFSLGDNSWRNIQSLPEIPLHCTDPEMNNGAYVSGTFNLLALRNNFTCFYDDYDWEDTTLEQFVILSLDLGTETYRQFLPPRGFDEVPHVVPAVGVLMDCLCFSHDCKGTDFVIWQMKEFGVEESWTPFLRISYQNLAMDDNPFQLLPLCLAGDGDTLILASDGEDQAILYNRRDNRVERTRITSVIWWFIAKDYGESLVSF